MKRWMGLAFMLIFVLVGCEKMQPAAPGDETTGETTKAEEGAQTPEAPTVSTGVTVATIDVGGNDFSVEFATTPEERAKGLMGRESLPENGGMFFVFDKMGQEKFWMKDTLIALDLIYIDEKVGEDGQAKPSKVVYIIENAVPESTEILESKEPFRYVLEVNAGTVKKDGIKVGDEVTERIGPAE